MGRRDRNPQIQRCIPLILQVGDDLAPLLKLEEEGADPLPLPIRPRVLLFGDLGGLGPLQPPRAVEQHRVSGHAELEALPFLSARRVEKGPQAVG
ncbi:MAG: hypothetical protein WKF75_13985, partial [Singulisphaera sp.]